MTISRSELQVTWDTGNNSDDVTTGGNVTSDAITFSATTFAAVIQCKANEGSTPAADDIIHFWLLLSSGDPDGASTDEYDTVEHGIHLGVADTYSEDPAIFHANIPVGKSFKIYAEGATEGTTNTITVSATVTETKG